jgi:hypothetical protein
MFSKQELNDMMSCWIHPDGTIQPVASEGHEDDLSEFCKTMKDAENSCVKVSCCWGYKAPISEIYLPRVLTIYQAQKLVEINESVKIESSYKEDIKINIWHNGRSWSEILDRT